MLTAPVVMSRCRRMHSHAANIGGVAMTHETSKIDENGTLDTIAREVEEHLASLLGWDP